MIYVIVGPSSSGKSSARQYITKQYGISGIDTDTLRTMTQILRPDMNIGHTQSVDTNRLNLRPAIKSFLYARSFFKEDYLLEGDAICIEDIKAAMQIYPLQCIVLGYPDDTEEERLAVYKSADPSYWIHNIDPITWANKVKDNIRYSQFLKDEANRLDVPYLEISGKNTINQNVELISQALIRN